MEFSLNSFGGALPVEVTLDEDNGRYMIRKSDTSGEVFNTAAELIEWVRNHFSVDQFCEADEFYSMMERLTKYQKENPLT
jgi:hypothetical protein